MVNSERTGSLARPFLLRANRLGTQEIEEVSLISRASYHLRFEGNCPAGTTVVSVICAQSSGATIEIYFLNLFSKVVERHCEMFD